MPNLMQKLQIGSEKRSVLIIEDDAELAASLSRILKMFFKEFIIAKDGEEALEIYKKHIDNSNLFTLIVTDLELPKKGGLSLIKEIRSLVKSQAILIISAHDEAQFMAEAISLDVQGYLLKPLFMPKLFENIEKILLRTSIDIHEEETVDIITGCQTYKNLKSFLHTNKNENTILLRIKINYLSNIYNLIGEEYADEYVKELSSLLKSLQIDPLNIFYRVAQDELVLVLLNKELKYANRLAKDMVSIVRYFHTSENGIIINSTLSIGIAHGSKNLLKYSQLALNESKNHDTNCVVAYTQSDYEKDLNITNGRKVMKMIYTAIETGSILPYLQPIINVKTQKTKIFNSYMRIIEDAKIYEPNTFLSIAQNAHQMSMITRSMIKNTLTLTTKIDLNDAILTVHLSSEDFYDKTLISYIEFWMNKYQIKPSNIGFEILSTNPYFSSNEEYSLVEELKKKGYKIILNRFGLDKCNLAYILKLRPDYIKIHTDLTDKVEEEPHVLNTIQQLIDIIHFIGLKAIATHISTKKQLNMLKTTNIDYVQGYEVCAPYEVK